MSVTHLRSGSYTDHPEFQFWEAWHRKWLGRIQCLARAATRPETDRRRARRRVRPSRVEAAWKRLFMPAMEAHYVMPASWLALTPEEKRTLPRPPLEVEYRLVRRAHDAPTGFSLDEVGPYLKLPDGTVFRDRQSARSRLWRDIPTNPGLEEVVNWLPKRVGRGSHVVKGRTAVRVLEALVCRSLTHLGATQIDAAVQVIRWSVRDTRDAQNHADENRSIWRELRIPPL